ncbi:hypothetical protein DA2_1702 [Desulfovibrio sp. A2]|nr:hypothetical protein DA2_1702 [Desulfovibrio sp. A2]
MSLIGGFCAGFRVFFGLNGVSCGGALSGRGRGVDRLGSLTESFFYA